MLRLWLERPRVVILATGWTTLILILSAIPGKDLPTVDIFQADKLVHAFMYGIMCWLWIRFFKARGTRAILFSVLFSSVFGMAMEFMQESCFEDRYFDWMDVLANEIGVLLAPFVFRKRI